MKWYLRSVACLFAALSLMIHAGCFFGPVTPANCVSDSECATGTICVRGACVAPTANCTGDSECATGTICERGACVAEGGRPNCNGDIRIGWEFNGVPACPNDVSEVVLKVFSPTGAAIHVATNGDTFACTTGEQFFRNLPCGTYQVQVQAIDGAGAFTWGAPQAPLDVIDQKTASITANLAPE